MDRSEIDAVRSACRLSDIVGRYTRLIRRGNAFTGLCPLHSEKSPSFHVRDDRGTYKCFGCGAWGDAIDFVMQMQGLGFVEAVGYLGGREGMVVPRLPPTLPLAKVEDDARRIRHAHELWLKREPVAGTLAERYLRETRNISVPLPSLLGFVEQAWCSPLDCLSPALLAPLQDENGHVTAVQLVFLCSETLDAWRDERGRRIKRTFGAMHKGAVRLAPPAEIMGIAGSVEDALSAMQMFSLPVWASCGEARIGCYNKPKDPKVAATPRSDVWIPYEVERIVVFADNDEAGETAARAFTAIHRRRIVVEIAPPIGSKDWSQKLMERADG